MNKANLVELLNTYLFALQQLHAVPIATRLPKILRQNNGTTYSHDIHLVSPNSCPFGGPFY